MNRKVILITIIFLLFAVPIIIWSLFFMGKAVVKTGLEFIVAPDNISISVANRKETVNYGSVLAFEPGDYDINLSSNGFLDKTVKASVVEGQITKVYAYLEPTSDAARAIFNGEVVSERVDGIVGAEVSEGATKVEKEYPFSNKLPIIDKYFSIKTCVDDSGGLYICAKLFLNTAYQKARAIQAANNAGIDTNKYQIVFSD